MWYRCIPAVVVCALAGCRVGPNYEPPAVSMPDAYAWSDPDQERPPAEPASWWRQFNDPVLDRLIGQASFSNFDLRIAVEQINEYRAAYGIAASELYPDISALASYTRERTPGSDVSGFSVGGDPTNDWSVGLDASWEIDLFGRIARTIEAARGDLQAIIEDWRYTLVTMRADVATSYITIRTLQARYGVAQKNIRIQRRYVELVTQQLEQGVTTEAVVAQARSQLAQAEALIPDLGTTLASEIANLALLLGTTPGPLAESIPLNGRIPEPPGDLAVGIPADLLRRRPDVRAAERELAAETARIGEAEAALYPQLSLSGTFGFTAEDFSNMFRWASRAYTFGPAFSWDIFNAGRLQSAVNQQEAATRAALLTYEQTIVQAIGEVESSLVGFVLAVQLRSDLSSAAHDARTAWELSMQQYERGVSNYLDVITSQQTLLDVEDSLVQAQGLAATSLVDVYRSIGGGWTPGALPQLAAMPSGDES